MKWGKKAFLILTVSPCCFHFQIDLNRYADVTAIILRHPIYTDNWYFERLKYFLFVCICTVLLIFLFNKFQSLWSQSTSHHHHRSRLESGKRLDFKSNLTKGNVETIRRGKIRGCVWCRLSWNRDAVCQKVKEAVSSEGSEEPILTGRRQEGLPSAHLLLNSWSVWKAQRQLGGRIRFDSY